MEKNSGENSHNKLETERCFSYRLPFHLLARRHIKWGKNCNRKLYFLLQNEPSTTCLLICKNYRQIYLIFLSSRTKLNIIFILERIIRDSRKFWKFHTILLSNILKTNVKTNLETSSLGPNYIFCFEVDSSQPQKGSNLKKLWSSFLNT